MKAAQLVSGIRRELETLDQAILCHPYPDALSTGAVPPEGFAYAAFMAWQ